MGSGENAPEDRYGLLASPRRLHLSHPAIDRRRFLRALGLLGVGSGVALLMGCRAGEPVRSVLTTLERTITLGPEGVLGFGPGEPHQVRPELAEAQAGREGRRRSLVVFHHFADAHILDEESPLRGEWLDSCPSPITTTAFRPHEALSLHITASLIRQANRIDRSPISGRAVDFLVHTGDAADNAQYNELRWFLDLMDGLPVEPDSGSPGYQGVQGESPDPRYPDLLQRAQLRFQGVPLRYPWYAVIGNHDILAQGNFAPSQTAEAIAVGESKVIDIAPELKAEVCDDPSVLLDPGASRRIFSDPATEVRQVAADLNRRLLNRKEWIQEHFKTAAVPGPRGHGFTQENLDSGTAYYVLEHGLVHFVVLDTVNPAGFSAGSIDRQQFRWLEEQLIAGSSRYWDRQGQAVTTGNPDRLFVILSHHDVDSMNNPLPDPATGEERLGGAQVEELLHRFPNVILHVAGHSRANRIVARPDPQGRGPGYWQVTTTSPLDFPAQGRLLEIVDNRDGTLSIFATVYDLAAPLDPEEAEDPTPKDGLNQERLAAIARRVAARDPQLDPAGAGLSPSDRNVELLIPAPFNLSRLATPPPHRRLLAQRRWGLARRQLLGLLFPRGL